MNKDDIFHKCALEAAIIAFYEGRIDDSDYIRGMAYKFYNDDVARENADKKRSDNREL